MSFQAEPLPGEFADALAVVEHRLGRLGTRILFFSAVDSTNNVAGELAAGGCEGAVVVAETQTAGRGRRGRSWFSPPGSGLYASVVLTPGHPGGPEGDRATALVTLAAGVALAEAVQKATGLAPAIKWPNDLLVGRRKMAGILAEHVSETSASPRSHVVIGYGVNVRLASYPQDLRDRVTSLESELGRPIDRATLFAETLASLAERYGDLLARRFDAILDAWRSRAPASRGARVSWDTATGPQTGTTTGVDDRGALLVQTRGRLERIVSGDVRWE